MPVPEKIKVLVAEDDEMLLGLFVRWLEAAGYWALRARDGERAIEAVKQAAPAIVVLDVTMPRLNGFQVLEALREMKGFSAPVIMLTGRQSPEDVRRAVSLGARDYLAKPVDRATLLGRVERLLRATAAPQKTAAG